MKPSSLTKKKISTSRKVHKKPKVNSQSTKGKKAHTEPETIHASAKGRKMANAVAPNNFVMKSVSEPKKKSTKKATNSKSYKQTSNTKSKKNSSSYSKHETLHISPEGHAIDDSLLTNNLVSAFTYGDLLVKMSENISNQLFSSINNMVSDNLEVSKDFFKCTTLTDMLSLQEKLFSTNCQILMNNMNSILSNIMNYHDNVDLYTYHKNNNLGGLCFGNFKM